MIIDFHTHTFPEKIASGVVEKLGRLSHTKHFTQGSVSNLLSSMEAGAITFSVNLPVMTSAGQVEKVNGSLIEQREALYQQGIITFGGMHPDHGDYRRELLRLSQNGIKGIKLHPAYQGVDLDDIRFLRIIDRASELGLIVLTHAGIDIGLPEHNYASVKQILHVIEEVQPEKFVLAHMGGWAGWDQVESDLAGAPVWLDTAFSIGAVTPDPEATEPPYQNSNLSDEAFLRIVRKHGTDRILFATDSPWEDQKDYVERLQGMALTCQEKEQIFSGNAMRLLLLET